MEREKLYLKSTSISLIIIGVLLLAGCLPNFGSKEAKTVLEQYWPPENLKTLTENPESGISIIDVRPAKAYESGHISTALSFPSAEIALRLKELSLDQYLIIYCETGGRVQLVITKHLKPNGYTRFMNWGGVYRWTRKGYNLVPSPNPSE